MDVVAFFAKEEAKPFLTSAGKKLTLTLIWLQRNSKVGLQFGGWMI